MTLLCRGAMRNCAAEERLTNYAILVRLMAHVLTEQRPPTRLYIRVTAFDSAQSRFASPATCPWARHSHSRLRLKSMRKLRRPVFGHQILATPRPFELAVNNVILAEPRYFSLRRLQCWHCLQRLLRCL